MNQGEYVVVGTQRDVAEVAPALRAAAGRTTDVALDATAPMIELAPQGMAMTGWGPVWSHARFKGRARKDLDRTTLVGYVRWEQPALAGYLATSIVTRLAGCLLLAIIFYSPEIVGDWPWVVWPAALGGALLGSLWSLATRTRADAEAVRAFLAGALA